MQLIIFDLDHTLLKVNSSVHFGWYLYHQNFFSNWTLTKSLTDYLRHKWGKLSLETLHENVFDRMFKGHALSEINLYVNQFLTEKLSFLLNISIIERLKLAQAQKHETVILSASPHFLVEGIARHLRVERFKGTHYQIDESGRFHSLSSVMKGENKAHYIQSLADELKISRASITVYSDSYLDLPLFQIAGRVVAVKPDGQLKKICLQNSWEIL